MGIRKANKNDVEQLVKIRLDYLKEDYKNLTNEHITELKAQLPLYFGQHLGQDMSAYIAEENHQIVSSVFLVIFEKPANPSFITGRTGTILNVYTKPEYRRRGLAGQLMKLAMQEAKESNLSYLELSASKEGYPLYRKLGFEETKSDFVPMKYIL